MKADWKSDISKIVLAGGLVSSNTSLCGLLQTGQNIINFGAGTLLPVLAILVIVYGGFRIMTAAGSAEGVSAGKDAIMAAVIGIIIVSVAWVVINTLLNTIGLNIGAASSSVPWNSISC